MIAIVSIAALILAGVAVALGIRIGSLKEDNAKLKAERDKLTDELKSAAGELTEIRESRDGEVNVLKRSIDEMQNDLEQCREPVVWKERLDRLRGLLLILLVLSFSCGSSEPPIRIETVRHACIEEAPPETNPKGRIITPEDGEGCPDGFAACLDIEALISLTTDFAAFKRYAYRMYERCGPIERIDDGRKE